MHLFTTDLDSHIFQLKRALPRDSEAAYQASVFESTVRSDAKIEVGV